MCAVTIGEWAFDVCRKKVRTGATIVLTIAEPPWETGGAALISEDNRPCQPPMPPESPSTSHVKPPCPPRVLANGTAAFRLGGAAAAAESQGWSGVE